MLCSIVGATSDAPKFRILSRREYARVQTPQTRPVAQGQIAKFRGETGCPERAAPSAAEFGCKVDKAVSDHVEIVLGAEIPCLVGSVFERSADEGGAETAAARGKEVA